MWLSEGTLTLSVAVFGAVSPSGGWDEAQLSTEDVGVGYREVVVADGSPLSLVEELYPALVVFAGVSGQADLQLLRGPGRGRGHAGPAGHCGLG